MPRHQSRSHVIMQNPPQQQNHNDNNHKSTRRRPTEHTDTSKRRNDFRFLFVCGLEISPFDTVWGSLTDLLSPPSPSNRCAFGCLHHNLHFHNRLFVFPSVSGDYPCRFDIGFWNGSGFCAKLEIDYVFGSCFLCGMIWNTNGINEESSPIRNKIH